jgi:hypothetical protein
MYAFWAFELFIVGLWMIVGWHSLRIPLYYRVEFVVGGLYALLFEELNIRIFKTYHYGEGYALVFGHVPVVIVLAWAVILSTSMQLSDGCKLSDVAKACCDGLLAVLLDLSLDAIAIRRGYWQWTMPLNAGWFGVPASNLYAWMFAVFFFSLMCRFVRRLYAKRRAFVALNLLVPPVVYLSLLISLVVVGTLNTRLQLDASARLLSVAGVMGLLLLGLPRGRARCGTSQMPVSPLIMRVRFAIHGFFIFEFIVSGLFLKTPLLVVVALGVVLVEIAVHRTVAHEAPPVRCRRGRPHP